MKIQPCRGIYVSAPVLIPAPPLKCCISFMCGEKTKSVIVSEGNIKVKESFCLISTTKIRSLFLRLNLRETQLYVLYAYQAASKWFSRYCANLLRRLKVQAKFFCFECGMNFSEIEMRHTIGDWFGVCKRCAN